MSTVYKWVRFRRGTSASAGTWNWREFEFPEDISKSRTKMESYFGKHYVSEIEDPYACMSEHHRGYEWQVLPIPKEFLIGRLKGAKEAVANARARVKRIEEEIKIAPVQKRSKKACRYWPGCGCINEFKTKDCQVPYAWEKK